LGVLGGRLLGLGLRRLFLLRRRPGRRFCPFFLADRLLLLLLVLLLVGRRLLDGFLLLTPDGNDGGEEHQQQAREGDRIHRSDVDIPSM
jgi:hypothetical protein